MEYQVIVSDKATRQIAEHVRFLANVSKPAAQKLKQTFVDSLHSLSSIPQRYPFFDEEFIPKNKYHKMVIDNRYMILYQIKDAAVFADYVVDCRQDYGWLIR